MRWTRLLIALFLAGQLHAQPALRTTRPPRRAVTVPPGFKLVEESNYNLLAEPADAKWVHEAMQDFVPATRPSTLPVDLIANLVTNQAAIKAEMIQRLNLTDAAAVDALFKDTLNPLLASYSDLKPPLFFLVITQDKLKQLIKSGWEDPRFHYNRAADQVEVTHGIALSIEGQMDDTVIPIILPPGAAADQRRQIVSGALRTIDGQLCEQIANRAQADMQLSIIAFCSRQVFEPLKLTHDQQWFAMGVGGILSSHFVEPIDGIDADLFIKGLSLDRRDNPIRSSTIDLLHPTPVDELRPASVPAYADAYQRRAIRIVADWVAKAGLDAPAKVIASLRKNPAADGNELLARIKAETSIDLEQAIKPAR